MLRPVFKSIVTTAFAVLPVLTASFVFGQSQTPIVNSLSESVVARSGRLIIFGSGFGNTQQDGQVMIDDTPAIVTSWDASEIHAYVPETASLGEVSLTVQTATGISNEVFIEVTLRSSEGRFLWRFEMDFRSSGAWTAIGNDGTIYCSDPFRMYALSPGGALKWSIAGVGNERPISVGDDGVIYVASNPGAGQTQGITAINPDSTIRWSYTPETGIDLLAGPTLGPDGNIYAVSNSNVGGPGLFAVDSDGNLLWESPGPGSNGITNYEILFDAERIFVPIWGQTGGPEILTYDFDGDLLWSSGGLGLAPGSAPELDPFGRLVLQWILIGTQVWNPDGSVEWIYDPPGSLGNVVPPTVDSTGVIYAGTWGGGDLYAVNPDGTTRWLIENQVDGFLWHLAVSPDDNVLIDGGAPDFGMPSSIRGFDTSNGDLLWIQDFHFENGLNEFAAWIEPTFNHAGNTIYVNTEFSSNTQPACLYAVDVTVDGQSLPGDVNLDGMVNFLDIAPFVELINNGEFQIEADINGDGEVNFLDIDPFVALLVP